MESSSGGWRGGAQGHQEPEPLEQVRTPKDVARALRSLAEQTRRQASWVRVRSGAAIDHASAVENQHRALSHGFGAGAPQSPPPESGPAGAGTPAEVARTLQLRAADARNRAGRSTAHLSENVQRARGVARRAAAYRQRAARDRRERGGRPGDGQP